MALAMICLARWPSPGEEVVHVAEDRKAYPSKDGGEGVPEAFPAVDGGDCSEGEGSLIRDVVVA